MNVAVPRLAFLTLLGAVALTFGGRALAGGPVFAIVPGRAAATPSRVSLDAAIRLQLAADRRALARIRLDQRESEASAELADARASSAKTADPIAAEDLAGRMRQAAAADEARAARLQRSIAGLEQALQPVVVPAFVRNSDASTLGSYAVEIADRYLGVRYVWGGGTPEDGFDCSGFVQYVYAQLGISLPHYAASQWADTMHVDPAQLEPGDLVFFELESDGPGHVGIYVGNGVFVEAPHTGAVVQFQSLAAEAETMGFVGASRPAA